MNKFDRPVSIDTTTPEGLVSGRIRYWPSGSGPMGVMKHVVNLIELLAKERGWDIDTIPVTVDGIIYTGNPPLPVDPHRGRL